MKKGNKIKTPYILLFITSVCASCILLIPSFLNKGYSSGLAGIAFMPLFLLLIPIALFFNYIIYRILAKLFNLDILQKSTIIVFSLIIILGAFPVIGFSYSVVSKFIEEQRFQLEINLQDESMVPVNKINDYGRPVLYEYNYQLIINNKSRKNYKDISIKVNLVKIRNSEELANITGNRYDYRVISLTPGKNIYTGQIPIEQRDYNLAKSFSGNDYELKISFPDQTPKKFVVISKIKDF